MTAFCTLIFILLLNSSLSFVLELETDEPNEVLTWPTSYHFRGEKLDIHNGFTKPFEIWYNADENKSRVDFDGGTVKHFYYAETEDEFGYKYSIFPVTNEEETNEIFCTRTTHDGDALNFLPDTDDYVFTGPSKYYNGICVTNAKAARKKNAFDGIMADSCLRASMVKGTEEFNSKQLQVWSSVDEQDGEKSVETLYVERTEDGFDIPVQYNKKHYNLWSGAIDGSSTTNYYQFEPTINPDDLQVDEDTYNCDEMMFGQNMENDFQVVHPENHYDLDLAFNSYKKHHNKNYIGSEHKRRQTIFHENWRRVYYHNRQNLSYKLALNQFADRTEEELQHLMATQPSNPKEMGTEPFLSSSEVEAIVENLPEELDLREEGIITPVKNQAACGSCWAFSTTAAVEGAISRANGGRTLDLSEQSLVDCAWGFENAGCLGGHLDGAMKYVLKHGVPTDSDYGEYLQSEGYCHIQNITTMYKIRGFGAVTPNSENALKAALYKYGPVVVAIHADANLKLYSSGIFYDVECDGEQVNHGVTVVGYGVRDGTTYWIVKNSWGQDWGEDGYVLMSAVNNNCRLLDSPYYAVA